MAASGRGDDGGGAGATAAAEIAVLEQVEGMMEVMEVVGELCIGSVGEDHRVMVV